MSEQQINLKQQISTNSFELLHQQFKELDIDQQLALHLRFWENCTIEEIASELDLSWDETDRLIETTLLKLRSTLIGSIKTTALEKAA